MSRTIESQLSLNEARARIQGLAEPGDHVEVSLGEALGLVLAEPVVADVDHPPFDRASHDGYAVRADEATPGTLLRVVRPTRLVRSTEVTIESGEAGRVLAGDPLPPGTDAVLCPSGVRPDPATGPALVVEVLQAARPNHLVTARGAYLSAGATVVPAGTRIRPATIPLLASQGCVHPFCHRRVRVSIVAVGNHWVGPADAPTMNRERNATSIALVALALRLEAMPHDFQAVSGSKIRPTLERAATSPVVIIVGASSRPLARALQQIGIEPVITGIAATPISRVRYGVIRDDEGTVVNHVFHLPGDPVAASVGFALCVQPLITRMQGEISEPATALVNLADGQTYPATRRRLRVVPATTRVDDDGRPVAEIIRHTEADLTAWSQATGVLIFPEYSGPWLGGDPVEYVPIGS